MHACLSGLSATTLIHLWLPVNLQEQLEGGASSSSSSSSGLTDSQKQWASIQKFKGKAGELLLLPGADVSRMQLASGCI
jgi:hypothetical protein